MLQNTGTAIYVDVTRGLPMLKLVVYLSVTWQVSTKDDHRAGVDSGRSLYFLLVQEPEPIFYVQAGVGAGVNIRVCAGANQNF